MMTSFHFSQSLSSLDGQDDEDDSDTTDNISVSSMDGRDVVGPSSPGHTSLSMAAACTMEEVANAEREKKTGTHSCLTLSSSISSIYI